MILSKYRRRYRPMRLLLLILIIFGFSFLFAIILTSIHNISEQSYEYSFRNIRKAALEAINLQKYEQVIDIYHHPFDNLCKFPIPNIYAKDIMTSKLAQRLRKLQCPLEDFDVASMDNEGFMYVYPNHIKYPKYNDDVSCKVHIIEGGLRANNKSKNDFYDVAIYEAPIDNRFWVNADAFYIRCQNDSTKVEPRNKTIFQKTFAGIMDSNYEKNKIILVPDLESFSNYGDKKVKKEERKVNRYSIDILGFDSTSRTMFMRHLPRTVEMMNKLGYHFLYGYNKIADNSMVNLAPILIGEIKEALNFSRTDNSSDININSILPQESKLDPTNLKFLWNVMKEKYGCETMFNEDISTKGLGLFTYPGYEFQPGFRVSPADHYYRAYYLSVYEKWNYSQCKDGGQIQNEFVDLWKRFSHKFKDICHFGFTFVTTLTHEDAFYLELLDDKLASHLAYLEVSGALDNNLSIILGDHGNRIGAIQWSYTGRIEERMPLMAIKLPKNFKQNYPNEYQRFLENKYKLTSNFDVHKMLNDIVEMRFGEERLSQPPDTGRGISLFDEIPAQRTCFEATVPENFCTCLVDVSNITQPMPKVDKINPDQQIKNSMDALRNWINDSDLVNCVEVDSLQPMSKEIPSLSLNNYARHGLRSKANVTANEIILKKLVNHDILTHEFAVSGMLKDETSFDMVVRTELFVKANTNSLVFQPFVRTLNLPYCKYATLYDICNCLEML